jgi:hypothetical protein
MKFLGCCAIWSAIAGLRIWETFPADYGFTAAETANAFRHLPTVHGVVFAVFVRAASKGRRHFPYVSRILAWIFAMPAIQRS